MSDRRVERTERPRDEGVYVSRTEEDKKGKEKFSPLPGPDEKQILFATFFSYLKKIFDTFSPSKKIAGKVIDQQEMISLLKRLKELFITLGGKDVSSHPPFAIALSDCWLQLMDQSEQLEILERKNQRELVVLKKLFNDIKHYPKNVEHSLGFYLYEHAGKDWLPFPFMEILRELHQEHANMKKESTLAKWTADIDVVIENLKTKFEFKL